MLKDFYFVAAKFIMFWKMHSTLDNRFIVLKISPKIEFYFAYSNDFLLSPYF